MSYVCSDLPPSCLNKINPTASAPQTASPSAVPLTCQNKQTKQTTQRIREGKDEWMDALACRRNAIWHCSERCTAEHCGSVISHFSQTHLPFCSFCQQTMAQPCLSPHKLSKASLAKASFCMHETLFKIYEGASSEMLLEYCVFQSAQP